MLSQYPVPAFDSLTNVVIRPQDSSELIGYIRTNNCTRPLCRVNGPLQVLHFGQIAKTREKAF